MGPNCLVLVISALILGFEVACFASCRSIRRQLTLSFAILSCLACAWVLQLYSEPSPLYNDRAQSVNAFVMCLLVFPLIFICKLSVSRIWIILTTVIAIYLTQLCLYKTYPAITFTGKEIVTFLKWAENPIRQILFDWSLIIGWIALVIRYQFDIWLPAVATVVAVAILVGLHSNFQVSVASVLSDLETLVYFLVILYLPVLILQYTRHPTRNAHNQVMRQSSKE